MYLLLDVPWVVHFYYSFDIYNNQRIKKGEPFLDRLLNYFNGKLTNLSKLTILIKSLTNLIADPHLKNLIHITFDWRTATN
jgi:hypothetical protein